MIYLLIYILTSCDIQIQENGVPLFILCYTLQSSIFLVYRFLLSSQVLIPSPGQSVPQLSSTQCPAEDFGPFSPSASSGHHCYFTVETGCGTITVTLWTSCGTITVTLQTGCGKITVTLQTGCGTFTATLKTTVTFLRPVVVHQLLLYRPAMVNNE